MQTQTAHASEATSSIAPHIVQQQIYQGEALKVHTNAMYTENTYLFSLQHAILAHFVFCGEIYASTAREVYKFTNSRLEPTVLPAFSVCFVTPSYTVLGGASIYLMTQYRIMRLVTPPNYITMQLQNLFICRGFCFDCLYCKAIDVYLSSWPTADGLTARLLPEHFSNKESFTAYQKARISYHMQMNIASSYIGRVLGQLGCYIVELTSPREYRAMGVAGKQGHTQ